MSIESYIKCAYHNRVTAAGWALAGAGGALTVHGVQELDPKMILSGAATAYVGMLGLFATWFAVETYDAYRRTQQSIQRFGTVRQDFIKKYSRDYCTAVGLRLALRERGLEHALERP